MATSVAPGRVNLIGEHVDYHGLPVLPAALTRAVRLSFAPRHDGWVRIANADPRHPERRFELGSADERDPDGDWGNYLRAAALVARSYGADRGVSALVDTDLPVAAGLSSSSALVVAMARALLYAAEIEVDPVELAGRVAEGERFVGTRGGGMDQAVCLGGKTGHALHIEFDPLRWTPVPLPDGWRIIVAHSGVKAEKSGARRDAYNERRRDGESALHAVAVDLHRRGASFGDLMAEVPVGMLLERGARLLDERRVRRFRHVVTEARRVQAAVAAIRAADLVRFGALLVESQASLRDDYEVSHTRLDGLVDAALEGGAAGARLTGAGFGGCAVAICEEARMEAVHDALQRALGGFGIPVAEQVLFAARVGEGARVEVG